MLYLWRYDQIPWVIINILTYIVLKRHIEDLKSIPSEYNMLCTFGDEMSG